MADIDENAVILEFIRIGAYTRLSAFDPRTLVEVQVMGPARGSDEMLKRTAIRKLKLAIERQRR